MHFRCWLPCRGTRGVCSPLTRGHGAHSGQTCNKATQQNQRTGGGRAPRTVASRCPGRAGPWLAPRRGHLPCPVFRLICGPTSASGPSAGNVRARVLCCAVLGTRGCSTACFFFSGRDKVLASPSHRPRILRLPGWRHCCRLPVPVQPRWVTIKTETRAGSMDLPPCHVPRAAAG